MLNIYKVNMNHTNFIKCVNSCLQAVELGLEEAEPVSSQLNEMLFSATVLRGRPYTQSRIDVQ